MLQFVKQKFSTQHPKISKQPSIEKSEAVTPPSPIYKKIDEHVANVCYQSENPIQWYPPVMISSQSLAQQFFNQRFILDALELIEILEKDDYTNYLIQYYKNGIERFGEKWGYADIITILLGLSEVLQPKNYLEIGVRRGRSVCAVASKTPTANLYMFDMWIKNYAGMENPGPDFVKQELTKLHHTGLRQFNDGNSHQTLKTFFQKNPSILFDLITVDGDHSFYGATEDLCDVLPHLKIGGAIVFDDICHPKHMYLHDVWKRLIIDDPRYTSWTCKEIGYGVGFALRKW